MKRLFILFIFTVATFQLASQEFSVPQDYSFETVDQIAAYEPEIISCIAWLEATPLDEQRVKRKEILASGF